MSPHQTSMIATLRLTVTDSLRRRMTSELLSEIRSALCVMPVDREVALGLSEDAVSWSMRIFGDGHVLTLGVSPACQTAEALPRIVRQSLGLCPPTPNPRPSLMQMALRARMQALLAREKATAAARLATRVHRKTRTALSTPSTS